MFGIQEWIILFLTIFLLKYFFYQSCIISIITSTSIMMEAQLLEMAKNDGFNLVSYRQNKERFSKCGICLNAYSNDLPPSLLRCGHFTCEPCYVASKGFCSWCNRAQPIKCKKYFKLKNIQNSMVQNSGSKTFNFVVNLNSGGCYPLMAVNGDTTFKALFAMVPSLDIFQRMGSKDILIAINGTSLTYEQIEKLPLKKFNEFLVTKNKQNALLNDSTSKRGNSITIHNRNDGGC